jgi:hypothetical protein
MASMAVATCYFFLLEAGRDLQGVDDSAVQPSSSPVDARPGFQAAVRVPS